MPQLKFTMKLAFKIVAVCLIAMMLITSLAGYMIARREIERAKERQQEDAGRISDLIGESLNLAYQRDGQQGIVQAIKTKTVETGALRYRWVWFDVSVNDPNRPAAPMDSLDKVLAGGMDTVVSTENGGKKLHTYSPLEVNDQSGATRKGAIEVSGSLDSAEQETWRTIRIGLGAMAAMTLFCIAFVTLAGVRMIGRPLEKLIRQTRKIGDGDYRPSEELNSKDEFGELSLALNSMAGKISDQQDQLTSESAEKVATLEQLRHADRLKTVGRLAAGLAHEIGTPLNVVSGRAGLIKSGKLSPQEQEESAAAIQSESNRIAAIVQQLMDFARHNLPNRNSVDLRVVVDHTVELLKTLAAKSNVKIEAKSIGDPPFTANVDSSQIQQVLTNLIVNSIQAMPSGGRIEVSIQNIEIQRDEKAVAKVEVEITDSGIGMDETTLKHIFDPFFTTKQTGEGTGLGLSIAHGIIEEHGGQIEVKSRPGEGTSFRVLLPKS